MHSSALAKCYNGLKSKFTVVLGSQWGDQGKGKLVSVLSDHYDVCARFNGGANAGHTVVKNGIKYAFHLVPSAIPCPTSKNLLGNGVVVNLEGMFKQLSQLDKHKISYKNRMFLSDRAHLVTSYQLQQDMAHEAKQNLGTTKKGIGPTYAAKIQRYGVRVGDLVNWNSFQEKYKKMGSFYPHKPAEGELEQIKKHRDILVENNMIVESVGWIHKQINDGKRILAEGANAALLDIDLGTYPYVTSSSTSIGGVCTGLGVPPKAIQTVIGVAKAYTTRVGEGPFPTELNDATGELLRARGFEFGTTTGRPRRCGWLDLNLIRYTNMINGYTSLNLTKADVLDTLKEVKVGVQYKLNGRTIHSLPGCLDDLAKVEVVYETVPGWETDITKMTKPEHLPKNFVKYVELIEKRTGIPISYIGNGPADEAMILRDI